MWPLWKNEQDAPDINAVEYITCRYNTCYWEPRLGFGGDFGRWFCKASIDNYRYKKVQAPHDLFYQKFAGNECEMPERFILQTYNL